jgi:hypothetical protein
MKETETGLSGAGATLTGGLDSLLDLLITVAVLPKSIPENL